MQAHDAPRRSWRSAARAPRRRRRLRRAALALGLTFAILAAATARVLIWPAEGMPSKVNAIVLMAGPGNLLGRAVQLAREGRAPNLVISLGTPDSGNACPARIPRVRIFCFYPSPASTQGEAEYVGRLARSHRWRSVTLVTITPQDTRARLRMKWCFAGEVYVVTERPAPTQANWPYEIVYQWGALLKALLFQRGC